jgi:hypothetical protein
VRPWDSVPATPPKAEVCWRRLGNGGRVGPSRPGGIPPRGECLAPTVQELGEKLPAVALDLLEEEGDGDLDDVPIEIIAHMSTRARRGAVA